MYRDYTRKSAGCQPWRKYNNADNSQNVYIIHENKQAVNCCSRATQSSAALQVNINNAIEQEKNANCGVKTTVDSLLTACNNTNTATNKQRKMQQTAYATQVRAQQCFARILHNKKTNTYTVVFAFNLTQRNKNNKLIFNNIAYKAHFASKHNYMQSLHNCIAHAQQVLCTDNILFA